jgi:hypothetical protein
MTSTAPDPARRREAALQALHNRYAPGPPPTWDGQGTWPLPLDTADRAAVAADIRTLAPLGRTPRWAKAIEEWAAGVEDPARPLSHAFFQGAVHAGYATGAQQ